MTLLAGEDVVGNRWAIEDGLHMLIAGGNADLTKGTKDERHRRYLETLRLAPELIEPEVLDRAELVSEITVAPESLMRGFFRRPTGPGWALLGDACHFKHPATAQGINDAVEQAIYVAEQLSTADGSLDEYEAWRDARAAEHYDWSFAWGRFPKPDTAGPLVQGLGLRARRRSGPTRHLQPPARAVGADDRERMARWFADAPAPTG